MSYNSRYFIDKENRKNKAIEHTKKMDFQYKKEIDSCVARTQVFSCDIQRIVTSNAPNIILCDLDSVSAAFEHRNGKTAILNFASYKNPGGMFINGSSAQEESLCHASFLYNVLKQCKDYYRTNRLDVNNHLYLNRCLYTPDVKFFTKDIENTFDVITCAAPNFSAYSRLKGVKRSDAVNADTLKSRINFCLAVAENRHVNTLIAGAFGCGVFRQDAEEVATYFIELSKTTTINTIVFAIPSSKDNVNFQKFSKVYMLSQREG